MARLHALAGKLSILATFTPRTGGDTESGSVFPSNVGVSDETLILFIRRLSICLLLAPQEN